VALPVPALSGGAVVKADRYVATAQIRAAMVGRETEILDALNIPWREGNPHIACPYPDHADENPSWRWDVRKARAFCTCGSRSVLGVLAKVERINFDQAKVRAAELLKRSDLIRENGARKRQLGGNDIPPEQRLNGATPGGCRLVDYASAKQLPIQFLRSQGLSEGNDPAAGGAAVEASNRACTDVRPQTTHRRSPTYLDAAIELPAVLRRQAALAGRCGRFAR
jgi:hypothetical protein